MAPVASPETSSCRKDDMGSGPGAARPVGQAGRMWVGKGRPSAGRAGLDQAGRATVTLPSFGKTSTIFCLPPTTSPRKLARSMSPFCPSRLHQDAGLLLGVMVSPCSVSASPWSRTCPSSPSHA